ncbi:hypothetical protein AB6A40_009555 [Gnathostoma spinigerum]|uniref:Uncharacterized protein n=1 Tax=Gnathostoma spinigerum TaxID=75299 RepID=A0ABD6EU46_9BILA
MQLGRGKVVLGCHATQRRIMSRLRHIVRTWSRLLWPGIGISGLPTLGFRPPQLRLFPKLKAQLKGTRFGRQDITTNMTAQLEVVKQKDFSKCIRQRKGRRIKYAESLAV